MNPFDAHPDWTLDDGPQRWKPPVKNKTRLPDDPLILEMQRLRRAFESADEAPTRGRPVQNGHSLAGRMDIGKPKPRQKKKRMARAIDICLRHFGIGHAAAPPVQKGRQRLPAGHPEARRRQVAVQPRLDEPRPIHAPSLQPRQFDPKPFDISRAMRDATVAAPPLPRVHPAAESAMSPLVVDPLSDLRAVAAPNASLQISTANSPVRSPASTRRLVPRTFVKVLALVFDRDRSLAGLDLAQTGGAARIQSSFDGERRTGFRVLLVVGMVIGSWATLVPLAGAVVVPGNLVFESNVKSIQHPSGGVVAEIAVRDGTRVRAGDLLVRLDPTQARASLQVVSKQLDDVRVRIARLLAERGSLSALVLSAELQKRSSDLDMQVMLASEVALFKSRTNARESQKQLLGSRVTQLGEEVSGIEAQLKSKVSQLELIAGELAGVQDLFDKRLVPLTRLTTLQRERARIEGERGQLMSATAETRAKIGEAELQSVRTEQDFRTEVMKDLGEAQAKEAELTERGIAARDTLDRIEIRAPTSGVVHQLAVHTIGGVIRAGDTVLQVVPDSEELQVEVRVQPTDIDQVRSGQKAFVRLSAFNQRVTPQLSGEVSYVSADTSHDQQTNAPYFSARVTLPEGERVKLANLQLVAGMPAEIFMQTGSRSMMSYLLKPISDQLQRAFVER
jgi:HlyD family secretion protein